MKYFLATIAVAVLVGCGGSSQSPSANTATSSAVSYRGFGADLNAFRANQGLGPMRSDATLARAAQAHAEDMVRRSYFSHDSPRGPNGDTFVERAQSAGCAMRAGAENIAAGQQTETAVLLAWQNSAGHRRNMLGANYTLYGLGRAGDTWVLKLASAC